jgi:acetylornithine deacetylase/succinyl-diaminopimelate desuccinylase-like protein
VSDELLAELTELIAIPTVSADPARRGDVEAGARWVCRYVKRLGGVAAVEADGVLAVGRVPASRGGDAPTVLVYGHFDVQPPEPLELWETDPFTATIRDGWIHGRGATDDKGQFLMLLRAVSELVEAEALPVNVVVLGDGEEEVGGTSAWDALRERAGELDAAVVFDGPSDSGGLELFLATRGLLGIELAVTAGEVDLHSGHYGGVALNAVNALVQTLAGVLPQGGSVPEELRVGVSPPPAEERARWATAADPAAELARRGARPLPGALDRYEERRWAEPSLDLHGILGGKPGRRNTSIPMRAQAELSVRLVPDQRVEEVAAAAERLLRAAAPPGTTLELRWEGVPPARVSPDEPAVRLAVAALERAFGETPRFVRGGGSLPVFSALVELGIPTVLLGFGAPEGNQHAPNERLRLSALPRGVAAGKAILEAFGRLEAGSRRLLRQNA